MYKTLEEEIIELWKRRGFKVLEEKFMFINTEKYKWTIIAERIEELK